MTTFQDDNMNRIADTGWMPVPKDMRLVILAIAALVVLLFSAVLIQPVDSDPLTETSILDKNGRVDHAFVDNNNLPNGVEGQIYWAIYDDTLYVDGREGYEFAEMSNFYGDMAELHDRPNWEYVDGWLDVNNVILTKAVTSIGNSAFCGPGKYLDVDIRFDGYQGDYIDLSRCTNLKSIGYGAFRESHIKYFEIPATVETVGAYAFQGAYPEYVFFLGQNVTEVGTKAFSTGSAQRIYSPFAYLEEISDSGGHDATEGYADDLHYYFDSTALHIEPRILSAEMSDYDIDNRAPWADINWFKQFDVIIENRVKSIGDYAFDSLGSPINPKVCRIGTMTIADSVESIGSHAFNNTYIESITIPENVKVASSAFENCKGISSLTISKGVFIQERAFADISVRSVDMHASDMSMISKEAFSGCKDLESVILPAKLCNIYENAFYGCSSLKSITLPETMEHIKSGAFYGCSSLSTIIYSPTKTFESIGDSAFCLNTDSGRTLTCTVLLEDISYAGIFDDYRGDHPESTVFKYYGGTTEANIHWTYKSGAIYIDRSASSNDGAMGDYSMTDRPGWETSGILDYVDRIVICSGITGIGSYAFFGMDLPIEFEDHMALKTIGDSAFEGCTSLDSISIPTTMDSIGDRAFAGCLNVAEIFMFGSSWDFGHIGDRAFDLGESARCIIYSKGNMAQTYMPNGSGSTHFIYLPFNSDDFDDGDDDCGDSDALVKGVSTIAVLAVTVIFIAYVARKD